MKKHSELFGCLAALGISLLFVSGVSAQNGNDPNRGVEPPLIRVDNVTPVDIYVQFMKWDKTLSSGGDKSSAIWTRAYGLVPGGTATVPGPTIRFNPGNLLQIFMHNEMDSQSLKEFQAQFQASNRDDPIQGVVHHELNLPHNPDNTNLHTHGLHVEPERDDVRIVLIPPDQYRTNFDSMLQMHIPPFIVEPQTDKPATPDGSPAPPTPKAQAAARAMGVPENLVDEVARGATWPYQYVIPQDHLPGTHWYHAHKHGATALHVENGMSGSFIIASENPKQQIFPNFPQQLDQICVIQKISNYGTQKGPNNGQGLKSRQAAQGGDGPQLQTGAEPTTINGILQPKFHFAPGQIVRLRCINAGSNHRTFTYFWAGYDDNGDGKPDQNADGSTKTYPLTLVAVDGITLKEPWTVTHDQPLFLAPGNRADVFVQMPSSGSNPVIFENDPNSATGTPLGNPISNVYNLTANSFQPVFWHQPANGTIAYGLQQQTVGGQSFIGFTPALKLPKGTPQVMQTWQPARPLLRGGKLEGLSMQVSYAGQFASNGQPGGGAWQVGPEIEQGGGALASGPLMTLVIDPNAPRYPNEAQALPTAAQLDPVSPTGNPNTTKLTKIGADGQPTTGIPGYVSPLTDEAMQGEGLKINKHRVVVFDKSGVNVVYDAQTTTPINQFSLNGRLFALNDSIGAPIAQQLLQTDATEVLHAAPDDPDGTVTMKFDGIGTWTNQVTTKAGQQAFWTNPGYFTNLIAAGSNPDISNNNTPTPTFNFNYGTNAAPVSPPTYQDVTGIDNPGEPNAKSIEEWVLINNSSVGHPFHIHINPFFVTDVGVLGFTDTDGETVAAAQQRGYVNGSWNIVQLGPDDPFGVLLNNWWDVIVIPPHGYVKFRTWVNIPTQTPGKHQFVDAKANNWSILENQNVARNWVYHCHILRHEDRGMMMVVQTQPNGVDLSGQWIDENGNVATVVDDHGNLTFAADSSVWWSAGRGKFLQRGLGDPFNVQPFLGIQMLRNADGSTKQKLTFCATSDGQELVFGNGIRWSRQSAPSFAPAETPISLTGQWVDSHGNLASIKDQQGALTFSPESAGGASVWWSRGGGKWNRGEGDPFQTEPFKGMQVLRNVGGETQKQSFCVASDGQSIVFGNGIKWTRQSN